MCQMKELLRCQVCLRYMQHMSCHTQLRPWLRSAAQCCGICGHGRHRGTMLPTITMPCTMLPTITIPYHAMPCHALCYLRSPYHAMSCHAMHYATYDGIDYTSEDMLLHCIASSRFSCARMLCHLQCLCFCELHGYSCLLFCLQSIYILTSCSELRLLHLYGMLWAAVLVHGILCHQHLVWTSAATFLAPSSIASCSEASFVNAARSCAIYDHNHDKMK